MQNKIEKLSEYTSSPDGYSCYRHPNAIDLMEKINEIIDYINEKEGVNAE